MGLTSSDINRHIYASFRGKGISHEDAMQKFPAALRSQVETDLQNTDIESHYGMSDKSFFALIGLICAAFILIPLLAYFLSLLKII